jgi:Domain of unknown function (DUF397)
MTDDEIVWRRAASCDSNGGSCLEVHHGLDGIVYVRSSTNPSVMLRLSPDEWEHFITSAAAGEFDLPG